MIVDINLLKFANDFLERNYKLQLKIPILINNRLKTTCGRFRYKESINTRIPISIELNGYFVKNNPEDVVKSVLKHELVHYALYVMGKPNKDGHPVFENELKKLCIVSQDNIDKYSINMKPITVNEYECESATCGKSYLTRKSLKNNGRDHRCNCGGKIRFKEKKKMSR